MTVDEISRSAYSGQKPDGMTGHESLLWYQLRDIYEAVRMGKMTKQVGAEEKQKAVAAFEMNKSLYDASVQLWTRIEDVAVRYAKERTIDNADAFYEAVYRMKPGMRGSD